MSYFGLLCKTVGNPGKGCLERDTPVMSDAKTSNTKNHLGCELQKIKGVGSCHNAQTLETAATVEGTVWGPGELILTVSDEVLCGVPVVTQ